MINSTRTSTGFAGGILNGNFALLTAVTLDATSASSLAFAFGIAGPQL